MPESALSVLNQAIQRLRSADISESELDAKYMVSHVLGVPVFALYTDKNLTATTRQISQISRMLKKRISGEPLQYIIGNQAFCGLNFCVNQKVLIPRPETEILVEKALEKARGLKYPKILDLCTGSGCIAIVLKTQLPNAMVSASDISFGALRVAKKNAKQHSADIRWINSDLYAKIDERFDLIVTNPPYINQKDYDALDTKVREHEPKKALLSGEDGLDAIRTIIGQAKQHLKASGWLLIEIGYDQRVQTEQLMEEAGFGEIQSFQDYSGFDRIVTGKIN